MEIDSKKTDDERRFIEFIEAREDSYKHLLFKYKITPVKGVKYISTKKGRFLMYEEEFDRLLRHWNSIDGIHG